MGGFPALSPPIPRYRLKVGIKIERAETMDTPSNPLVLPQPILDRIPYAISCYQDDPTDFFLDLISVNVVFMYMVGIGCLAKYPVGTTPGEKEVTTNLIKSAPMFATIRAMILAGVE